MTWTREARVRVLLAMAGDNSPSRWAQIMECDEEEILACLVLAEAAQQRALAARAALRRRTRAGDP